MSELYYIQSNITSGFAKIIKNSIPNIRKTQLNFLLSLMYGMIYSESCASSDIAKSLQDELKWTQYDSVVKRINRFFNNKHFGGKKIKKRVMSLFNTGLTLFKVALNSFHYIRLPMTFKIYDI